MNKNIVLATGNKRKAESLNKAVSPYGFNIEINNLELPEIQSNSTIEIAAFAAKWGAEKIKKPCVKMDSGFYIEEFKGFPGPYVRWVDEGLGVEKFFELLKNIKDNKASIECSVAYCEPHKEPILFTGRSSGLIPMKAGTKGSFIDRLFVPSSHNPKNLTMGELRETDPDAVTEIWGSAEKEFITWLSKK